MPKVTANGITFYYEEEGKKDAPPLVLISGLSREGSIWKGVIPFFAPYFRVITFDNRGVGRTDAPLGPYTISLMGEDVSALLKALHLPKAHVVGHSLGSLIGQYLGAYHKEQLAKLVLCCTCLKPSPTLCRYLRDREGISAEEAVIRFASLIFSPHFLTPEKKRYLLEVAKQAPFPQSKEGLKGQIDACFECDSSSYISKIQAHTLVLSGKYDPLMTPEENAEVASRIKGARHVVMEEASHMLHVENPEDFSSFVTQFCLEKQQAGRTA